MNLRSVERSKSRFAAYVEGLVSVIGHADRASPLRDYCLGLIMPCERKSVEPMAAITAPDRTAAQHQSLLHFVGQSPWSNEKGIGESGRNGRAGNRAPRTDRSVDHRRHWFSQERPTLGLRGTPVLRSAREAGELPSGGVAVTRQSPREPAGRLASLSTERVGGRPRTSAQGGGPRWDRF